MLSSNSKYSSNVLVKNLKSCEEVIRSRGKIKKRGAKKKTRGAKKKTRGLAKPLPLGKAGWQDMTWATRKMRKMMRTWITALKQWDE
jgi:hypothetical protein